MNRASGISHPALALLLAVLCASCTSVREPSRLPGRWIWASQGWYYAVFDFHEDGRLHIRAEGLFKGEAAGRWSLEGNSLTTFIETSAIEKVIAGDLRVVEVVALGPQELLTVGKVSGGKEELKLDRFERIPQGERSIRETAKVDRSKEAEAERDRIQRQALDDDLAAGFGFVYEPFDVVVKEAFFKADPKRRREIFTAAWEDFLGSHTHFGKPGRHSLTVRLFHSPTHSVLIGTFHPKTGFVRRATPLDEEKLVQDYAAAGRESGAISTDVPRITFHLPSSSVP